MRDVYGLTGTLTALIEAEAARAGERARIMLELKEIEKEERRSIRRRLAETLVQLGVKLDPLAADSLNEDE